MLQVMAKTSANTLSLSFLPLFPHFSVSIPIFYLFFLGFLFSSFSFYLSLFLFPFFSFFALNVLSSSLPFVPFPLPYFSFSLLLFTLPSYLFLFLVNNFLLPYYLLFSSPLIFHSLNFFSSCCFLLQFRIMLSATFMNMEMKF